jgi:hypothetical protein
VTIDIFSPWREGGRGGWMAGVGKGRRERGWVGRGSEVRDEKVNEWN